MLPNGAVCVAIADLETVGPGNTNLSWVLLAYEDFDGAVLDYHRLEGDELKYPTKAALLAAIAKANEAIDCPRCGQATGRYGP